MEEQKRIFLVVEEDEIPGIRPPKGVYFTKFLSEAQEIWLSERLLERGENPYELVGRCRKLPVRRCQLVNGTPTIHPKQDRTMEKAYEL